MGTNYYCYEKNHRRKHIGKQSCRQRFLFQGYSDSSLKLKSYSDWKEHLLSAEFEIYNEYHKQIEKTDFFMMIEKSMSEKPFAMNENIEGWYDDRGYCFLKSSFS